MTKASRAAAKTKRRKELEKLREPLRAEWIASGLRPIFLVVAGLVLILVLAVVVQSQLPPESWSAQQCTTVESEHVESTTGKPKEVVNETVLTCESRGAPVSTLISLVVIFGLLMLPELATLLPGFSITTPFGSAKTQRASKVVAKATAEKLTSAAAAYSTILESPPADPRDDSTSPA